jgi:Uncharacterized protein conserved in bacteria
MKRFLITAGLALMLSSCQTGGIDSKKALAPIPSRTVALMSAKSMSPQDPIVIRSYKKESELEVWKMNSQGRYQLLKTFPICRWSGQLGPKRKQGDRQAPEGFYTITPAQMNPNSSYYLSFDTGFPNAYDRAHGRTGSHLMVHGSCSSAGCFAMTDAAISEIYAIGREAFRGGQRSFQFQSYPFRMTVDNMAKYRGDANYSFWKNLKQGSDYFEITGKEPKVSVCNMRYIFGEISSNCEPVVNPAILAKAAQDDYEIEELSKKTPAVRLVYHDGGQHHSFRNKTDNMMVSRPEAVLRGPQEVVIDKTNKMTVPALAFTPAQTQTADTALSSLPQSQPEDTDKTKLASRETKPGRDTITEEKPVYRRVINGISGLLGTES